MSKREQEIIAAAAKVFKEKGYHAATTRDIAAEVGTQQATLYYYISSTVCQRYTRWDYDTLVCGRQPHTPTLTAGEGIGH